MQTLRSSFQQMVVNHQVQTPNSNRNQTARRAAQRQQRLGLKPAPMIPVAPSWPLQAVRADQATDLSDTAVIQQIADISRKVDEAHAAALQRNVAAVAGGIPEPTSELKSKVQTSVLDLQDGLLERETEVRKGFVWVSAIVSLGFPFVFKPCRVYCFISLQTFYTLFSSGPPASIGCSLR